MFADACEKAMRFTRPVIVSTRCVDGTTQSGCGAFIVINRDGWIITAGHLFSQFIKFQQDKKKIDEIDKNGGQEQKDPKWFTHHSFWWGWDRVNLVEGYIDSEIDIAVGRLEGFKPQMITEYPVFKDPDTIRPGTSLCRIGFPFTDSTTDFNESNGTFCIRKGVLPMPFFPNDGIHTRNIYNGKSKSGNYDKLYIETSTPGMKGQSGGPIFDRNGYIAGMQVRTMHMPLGFSPVAVDPKGEKVIENQFLNVGVGLHVKSILQILDDRHIKYDCERDDQGYKIVG